MGCVSHPRLLALAALFLGIGCAARDPGPSAKPTPNAESRPEQRIAASAPAPAPTIERPASTASAPIGFLKGQTHVHTDRSYDAKTPPAVVLDFYKSRGYDFVALTDHNRVTVVDSPEGLLLVPGIELSQNSTTCAPKPAAGFRCLFHTSGLFLDPARDRRKGERIPLTFLPDRERAYEQQLDVVDELGGIGVLNHPLFHFALDQKLIAALGDRVHLIELINASLDTQNPSGRPHSERRAEALWDQVLTRGTLVYGLATDDSHHFDDAGERAKIGKHAYVGDRAWIMVRAEKSISSLRKAVEKGDFYATTGVVLEKLETGRERISLRIKSTHPPVTTRFIGREGRELHSVRGLEASYTPRGDEGYVRAVVSDDAGRKAWVQPVMLSR